jgi:hypothetical protein
MDEVPFGEGLITSSLLAAKRRARKKLDDS